MSIFHKPFFHEPNFIRTFFSDNNGVPYLDQMILFLLVVSAFTSESLIESVATEFMDQRSELTRECDLEGEVCAGG